MEWLYTEKFVLILTIFWHSRKINQVTMSRWILTVHRAGNAKLGSQIYRWHVVTQLRREKDKERHTNIILSSLSTTLLWDKKLQSHYYIILQADLGVLFHLWAKATFSCQWKILVEHKSLLQSSEVKYLDL